MCGVIYGQSGCQNDDDGRGDLYRQSPVVHEAQQIDQCESDAGEHPEDGHQIRNEDQCHTYHSCHSKAQVANQFAADHL